MARKLRVEFEEAVYHVMNRGDQRERIFVNDEDRRLFLATLGEASAKTEWQAHAFCLMSNHSIWSWRHLGPICPRACGGSWELILIAQALLNERRKSGRAIAVVNAQPEMIIAGEASDGHQAIQRCRERR